MLIDGQYLNLIVAGKAIHKWEDDTPSTFIDNLIDVWSQKVVLRTSFVQLSEIDVDLNKACPKDNFRTPHIDQIINNCAGSVIFSFMDGFSSYNQIEILPTD